LETGTTPRPPAPRSRRARSASWSTARPACARSSGTAGIDPGEDGAGSV